MAKLRFPGRPGHRFDRISVKFFTDDIKNLGDPSLAFLPQFQRGLQAFRDLVGPSDEDDDFEGFSEDDIRASEEKLEEVTNVEKKVSPTSPSSKKPVTTRLSHGRHSLDATSVVRQRRTARKSQNMTDGLETPRKSNVPVTKGVHAAKIKPKKFKLDYKHGLQYKGEAVTKTKKSDMDMAKFLLDKAKQANILQEKAKAKRLKRETAAKQTIPKREFVLPKQSSRSSRVIKPNKRFLEEEIVSPTVKKKPKPEDGASGEIGSPTPIKGRSFSLDSSKKGFLTPPQNIFPDQSVGLLDQPLIVDGKRDRKPSLKLQLSDEDSFLLSPEKSPLVSPLAAPKLGTGLFQQSQFQKASDKLKFGMLSLGSGRKHGASIVQKAKLQLNRAALNKSKAALARSLKAEMKREAKFAEQLDIQGEKPVEIGIGKQELKKMMMKKFRKRCCICDNRSELAVCYSMFLACYNCKRFYRDFCALAEKGEFVRPVCPGQGKCKIVKNAPKLCRDCRLRKCLEMGFPAVAGLDTVYGFKKGAFKMEKTKKEAGSVMSSPEPVQRSQQMFTNLQSPSNEEAELKSPQTPAQDVTEQELSPVKAGEGSEKRKRKRRAFKELLRTKQEKPEEPITVPYQVIQVSLPEIPVAMPVAVGSVEISPRGSGTGPRIKHVCRNAAVALGKPLAMFPEKLELRLSALPTKEKVQLWRKDEESKAADLDSDDDRPMDEIIQQSGDSVVILKKSPAAKLKATKKLTGAGGLSLYKRRMRCKKCPGCLAKDCGTCRHCQDMKKFGGPGTIKKACVKRRCANPVIKRSATEAFIDVKQKPVTREKTKELLPRPPAVTQFIAAIGENVGALVHQTPTTSDLPSTSDLDPIIPGSESTQTMLGLETQTGTLIDDQMQTQSTSSNSNHNTLQAKLNQSSKDVIFQLPRSDQRSSLNQRQSSTLKGQGSEVRKLTFGDEDAADFQLERLPSRKSGKLPTKLVKSLELNQKYTRKEGGNDGQCYPVTLQSVNPASRQWGSLLSQPRYYPVRVDFKSSCDINNCWRYGMALTMSSAMSVRTLCFLCGSAGKHDMIFCNICCEPFHEFCLEDWEQPSADHYEDWICAACQFCHVCGRQNNLLQCDKCQNTYHPGCLGPNYPTKPSKRKGIWICTKCVKCKSCGATTPGSAAQATWTYDFSLCFECGLLMDKGNFCPICKKCYSDDDWESKMIQCNMCQSWVHSKCEGLTDEMYEILSYLPEDLSFYCRKCFPVGCPEWESTLKRELKQGLENILQTLILAKSAKYILKHEKLKKVTPPKNSITGEEMETTPEQHLSDTSPTDSEKRNCVRKRLAIMDGLSDSTKCNIEENKPDSKSESVSESVKGNISENVSGHDKKTCGELGEQICDIDSKPDDDGRMIGCDLNTKVTNSNEDREGSNRCSTVMVNGLTGASCDLPGCENSNAQYGCGDNVTNKVKQLCDSNEEIPRGTEHGCGGDFVNRTGNSEKRKCDFYEHKQTCDTVRDKDRIDDSETVKHNCEKDRNDMKHSSDVCDTETGDEINNKLNTECSDLGDKLKKETAFSDDSKLDIQKVEGMEIEPCSETKKEQTTGNTVDCLGKSEGKKAESETLSDGKELVERSIEHRVHFVENETKSKEESSPVKHEDEEEDMFPEDLMEIAQRMKDGEYKSVAIFCEDILRVIQKYLDCDAETRAYRKKAIQTAKSVFVKQVERIFPWFNVKTCRHWYSSKSLPHGMLPDATLPPGSDHTYAQWLERVELPRSPQPSPYKKRTATPVKKYVPADDDDFDLGTLFEGEDERLCMFCQTFGDQDSNEAGRLLYCGQDDWCHVNCALWSAEVYEDSQGALQNLTEAFSRGKMLRCDLCGKSGATVGCNTKGCKANYHFMCARKERCRLQEDKKVFCHEHRYHIDGELLPGDRYNVLRRVYVKTLNIRSVKKRWSKGLHVADISVLMGSCCIESLGRLTNLSDKPKYLHPVDFLASRMYWSTKDARRRCVYTCRIVEVRPEAMKSPTISIRDMTIIHDPSHPDFVPLSSLDLTGYGINLGPELQDRRPSVCEIDDSEDPIIDLTGPSTCEDLSRTLSAEESMDFCLDRAKHYSEVNSSKSMVKMTRICSETSTHAAKALIRSSSFSSMRGSVSKDKDPDRLSSSWPVTKPCKSPISQTPNLSFLSPQTLKLLNIKDSSKYSKPVQNEGIERKVETSDDGLNLLKIADRLNSAAGKRTRRSSEERNSPLLSRSPSAERGLSPMPVRPFSPILSIRSARSHSVDRVSSPTICQPKMTSILGRLPDRPFSPPFRMLARSRSLSVEKENFMAKFGSPLILDENQIDGEPFLPKFTSDSSYIHRRGRSVSDPISPTPKPVGFSSPVVAKQKEQSSDSKGFVLSDISAADDNSEALTKDSALNPTETRSEMSHSGVDTETSIPVSTYSTSAESSNTTDVDKDTLAENNTTVTAADETEQSGDEEIINADTNSELDSSVAMDTTVDNGDDVLTSTVDTMVDDEDGEETRECSETIVVMTESGESLSEEEAIKIVQDMLEKRNSSAESNELDNEEMSNESASPDNGTDSVENEGETGAEIIPDNNREDIQIVKSLEESVNAGECKVESQDSLKVEEYEKNIIGQLLNNVVDTVEKKERIKPIGQDMNENKKVCKIEKDEKPASPFIPQMNDTDRNSPVQPKIRGIVHTRVKLVTKGEHSNKRFLCQRRELDGCVLTDAGTIKEQKSNSIIEPELSNTIKTSNRTESNSVDGKSEMLCVSDKSHTITTEKVMAGVESLKDTGLSKYKSNEDQSTLHEENRINTNEECGSIRHISDKENEKIELETEKTDLKMDVGKADNSNFEEIELLAVDPESSDESDIVDITESVEAASKEMESEPSNESITNGPSAKVEFKKPLVYDLDESIDSDIEILDDIGQDKIETDDNDKDGTVENSENFNNATMHAVNDLQLQKDEIDGDQHGRVVSQLREKLVRRSAKDNEETMPANRFKAKPMVRLTRIDGDNDTDNYEVLECDDDGMDLDPEEHTKQQNILRGLGLGTYVEVEKLKNSPPKPAKLFFPTDMQQESPPASSPVKSYPLRKNLISPARYRDGAELFGKRNLKEDAAGTDDSSVELPVLDPIAKKIKEESIAKSCPGEKGPFKCSKCRRMYRTESSYKVHIENCNFCVSSSDDDSNSLDSSKPVEQIEARITRSRHRDSIETKSKRIETKATEIETELAPTEESNEVCEKSDSNSDSVDKVRSSLRQSTVSQRVALEVEDKRMKEEKCPKRRGRPSLNRKSDVTEEKAVAIKENEVVSKSLFYGLAGGDMAIPQLEKETEPAKRGRGRPRKIGRSNSQSRDEDTNSEERNSPVAKRLTRSRSQESILSESQSDQSAGEVNVEKEVTKLAELVNRKRSFGKHSRCESIEKESDLELKSPATACDSELKSPATKRKAIDLHKNEKLTDINDFTTELAEDTEATSLATQRGRGRRSKRGRKPGYRKNKKQTGLKDDEVVVIDDASSDEGEELDPTTGLVVDKKTREVIRDPADETPQEETKTDNGETKTHNCDTMTTNSAETRSGNNGENETDNGEIKIDKGENKTDDGETRYDNNGGTTANETGDSIENNLDPDKTLADKVDNFMLDETSISKGDNSEKSAKSTAGDNEQSEKQSKVERSVEEPMETENYPVSVSADSDHVHTTDTNEIIQSKKQESERTNSNEHNNTKETIDTDATEDKGTSEGAQNMSIPDVEQSNKTEEIRKPVEGTANNLPEAVLKLLKDGHKVVIRNPKLNRNFMWQKTEKGYIGKPFDKELPLKSFEKSVGTLGQTSTNENVGKSGTSGSKNSGNETGNKSQSQNQDRNTDGINSDTQNQGKNADSVSDNKIGPVENGTVAFKAKSASDILFERIRLRKEEAEKQTRLAQISQPHSVQSMTTILSPTTQPQTVYSPTSVMQNAPTTLSRNFQTNNTRNVAHQNLLEKNSKYVVENIAQLIQKNMEKLEKASVQPSTPTAEYVGGVLITSPKVQSLNQYKQTIESTVPVATYALQNTLQLQNQLGKLGPGAQAGLMSTVFQGNSQTIISDVLSPPQVQFPIMHQMQGLGQLSPPGLANILPTGYTTYASGNIQAMNQSCSPVFQQQAVSSPTGIQQQTIVNQSGLQCIQPQVVTSVGALSQLPVIGMMQMPLVGSSQVQLTNGHNQMLQYQSNQGYQAILPNADLQQNMSSSTGYQIGGIPVNIVPAMSQIMRPLTMSSTNVQPQNFTSALQTMIQQGPPQQPQNLNFSGTVRDNLPSIITDPCVIRPPEQQRVDSKNQNLNNFSPKKSIPISPRKTSSTKKVGNKISPLRQALTNDDSKPYFTIKPGLGGGSTKLYEKMKLIIQKRNKVSARKTYLDNRRKSKSPPYAIQVEKKTDSFGKPNVIIMKKKDHGYSSKTRSPRKKKVGRPKETEARRLKRLLLPHVQEKKSHPIIHGQKEVTTLPVAAVEEEVRDIPLSALEEDRGPTGDITGSQNLGHLEFEITSDDGFTCRADTIDGAWKQVTEKLQDARTASRLKHLSYAGLSGVQMFGLSHPQVMYLVEQLYGASYCRRYKFKYHRHELVEKEIELLNPTGCLRTEPFMGRNPWDMFSFLMSRYRMIPSLTDGGGDVEMVQKSSRRATSMDLPMAMRFRKLKYYSKECVGVYRSTIHGRGLFCKRSIDAGEMIIEYAGEVIRNALTDLREKYYESKGIGCYMFRIDDQDVVDATMKGSAARFINHSCDPNCYSKVITVDNRKHIVIFALRKIIRGEELTYDYKFPIEEVKIPCTCGSRRCRKYLN